MPVLFPAVITGASGFVGRVLARRVEGAHALAMGRDDWQAACAAAPLRGAIVYHLAARAHEMEAAASEAQYLADNAEKTRVLAERAAAAGARAFVFLSTVKVNGEESRARAFTPDDVPAPEDAYARSKLAAEVILAGIASRTGLRVAIVRSPLVYGPRVKGNLATLVRLADSPWPLPFAALDQPRSFVHVEDLCEALLACGAREQARGVYLVAHEVPVTTARLVASLRDALGRSARLFPVPARILEGVAALAGQRERARRLTRALVADPGRAQRDLDWRAKVDIDAALREVVAAYREGRCA